MGVSVSANNRRGQLSQTRMARGMTAGLSDLDLRGAHARIVREIYRSRAAICALTVHAAMALLLDKTAMARPLCGYQVRSEVAPGNPPSWLTAAYPSMGSRSSPNP